MLDLRREDVMGEIPEIWCEKFKNVAKMLKELYSVISRENKNVGDLLKFATLAEKVQSYPWTYLDYSLRVPIYRTMQWLSFEEISSDDWKELEKIASKSKRSVMLDLYKHILKEYITIWARILSVINEKEQQLSDIIKHVLHLNEDPIKIEPWAFKDIIGLKNELMACYVLIDHSKPFLPFSIMQAPITPSYIRPGASSGDLYLFEENLVIDVKKGWLKNNAYPTYYYGKDNNLSVDLKKISDLHFLYGIRKGLGVIAEDEECVHLAIYVPWRRWRLEGPLIYLKSVKLPLLLYMHRIGDRGIKLHEAFLHNNELTVYINLYQLDRSLHFEETTLRVIGKTDEVDINNCSWNKIDQRTFGLKAIIKKDIGEYVFNTRFILASLSVSGREYPVVALLRSP